MKFEYSNSVIFRRGVKLFHLVKSNDSISNKIIAISMEIKFLNFISSVHKKICSDQHLGCLTKFASLSALFCVNRCVYSNT